MTHNRTARGFTLVEMLVYLALTVLITLAGVLTYLSLDTVLVRVATERALRVAAEASMERMIRDIRAAESVNLGMSTLGSSPGVLVLEDGATTTTFSESGDALHVAVNGTDLGPLTGNAVTVDDVVFTRYTGANTELVRVALTLSVESKAASSTRTYYGSAVLRGTYE